MFDLTRPLKTGKGGLSRSGFGEMQHEMERLFGSFFAPDRMAGYSDITWYPAVDLCEKEDAYLLKAELPGMSEKDIQINAEDNVISLQGEKKEEKQVKSQYQHRLERTTGKFYRSFQLPSTIDAEKIEAQYKNGILEVSIPKSKKSKPKVIKID